jgi:hypothetical protein
VAPVLVVTELGEDNFLLTDTRPGTSQQQFQIINGKQAELILGGANSRNDDYIEWAIRDRLIVEVDGKWVPLAYAPPEVFTRFEASFKEAVRAPAEAKALRVLN